MTASSETTAVTAARGRKLPLKVTMGTALLVAGVAGLVVVPRHAPRIVSTGWGWGGPAGIRVGWSQTAYDAAQIGAWALMIVGAVLVTVGLINYARRSPQ